MTNDTMTKEFPMPNAQATRMDRVSRRSCGLQNGSLRHWSFLLVFAMTAISLIAGVTEPGTVFYGKVVNRTSGQEYVMSEGALTWVIVKPDGRQITLSGSLQPLNDGQ